MPVRSFIVYQIGKRWYGYEDRDRKPYEIAHRFERSYSFKGRTQHIFIFSDDTCLTEKLALALASAFARGLYQTTHIDLSLIGTGL